MGLSNNTGSRQTFVTIVGGKFTIRLPDGDDNANAVERTLEKGPHAGSVVRELQYNWLSGKIVSAEMRSSDYGTDFTIVLADDGEQFKLQIPLESQYFGQVAKRLPNLSAGSEVGFGLGFDKERNRNFLYIKQNGESVRMKFTRDEPNGMPPPVKKTVRGIEKWDFEEQENFLYEVAVEWIDSLNESPSDHYTDSDAPAEPDAPEFDQDDVPF